MIKEDYNKETMAKVTGRSVPISTRHAIEISNFIRNKNVQKMKAFLEDVINMKKALPFTRFNKGLGHKTKIGPGRYPIKSSKEVLALIQSAESNAQFKGLNTADLIISKIVSNQASTSWHYGRKKRRKMKRTNIEIILTEKAEKAEKPSKKQELKKEAQKKQEVKKGSVKND